MQVPVNEGARLEVLHSLDILHTLPERAYRDAALVASSLCRTPAAMVSLVAETEVWYKASVGIAAAACARADAFCAHTILDPDRVLVVPDAAADARFSQNPTTIPGGRVRFYAGAPLVTEHGEAIGALAVMDCVPRQLPASDAAALADLARLVMALLETRRTVRQLEERALEHERDLDRLETSQRELAAAHDRLAKESVRDPLTGLCNRNAFEQRLEEESARVRRTGSPLSLILMDVDRFQQYRQWYGEAAADDVLMTMATILASAARTTDVVYRFGADRFAILLPGTPEAGAVILADRFRRLVQGFAWERRRVSACFGVATLGHQIGSRQALLRAALHALHEARQAGRNRVVQTFG